MHESSKDAWGLHGSMKFGWMYEVWINTFMHDGCARLAISYPLKFKLFFIFL